MMFRTLALAMTSLFGATGCALVVDANDYDFGASEVPLCPPVTDEQCGTGERYTYLATSLDTARETEAGAVNGFDLDQTTAAVCGHDDHTAPDGTPGIDNGFLPLVLALEASAGISLAETSHQAVLDAVQLNLIDVSNVDDLDNDPCVDVALRQARLPEGVDATVLDQEAPFDEVDVGVRLDYETPSFTDPRACIVDGRLLVDFGDGRSRFPVGEEPIEIFTSRNRLSARLTEDRLLDGVQAGAVDTAEFSATIEEVVGFSPMAFLDGQADLDPDEAGRCQSLSFGFVLDGVRIEPGNLL